MRNRSGIYKYDIVVVTLVTKQWIDNVQFLNTIGYENLPDSVPAFWLVESYLLINADGNASLHYLFLLELTSCSAALSTWLQRPRVCSYLFLLTVQAIMPY